MFPYHQSIPAKTCLRCKFPLDNSLSTDTMILDLTCEDSASSSKAGQRTFVYMRTWGFFLDLD